MLPGDRADTVEEKKMLRRQAGATRARLQAELGADAGGRIRELGLELLGSPQGRVVAGFHPYRSEVDVMPLLEALGEAGWKTALPVIVEPHQPLAFRSWSVGEDTAEGHYGILAPRDHAAMVDPDLLLVPMLAFDRDGYRLGYGGGFYDRTLHKLRALKPITAIGIAFSGQELDSVPHDSEDQHLDWILTERGPVYPRNRPGREAECD